VGAIKCVIWDLDDTLWKGSCLEDAHVELKAGVRDVLDTLRGRGILQAVASKNEPAAADFVERMGIAEYFVQTRINWDAKEDNIRAIAESLNIGLDAVAFVDDNPFELESVAAMLPEVTTWDAADYLAIPDRPEVALRYDTYETRARSTMYVDEERRKELAASYEGQKLEFMRDLGIVATARNAGADDLPRIQELVTRTNQFNSTGIRYSDADLEVLFRSPDHTFHVVSMIDRFGDYGRCGVALVRDETDAWSIESLLLSCRVAGRGLGSAFIAHLGDEATRAGTRQLRARYIKTDRNRQIGLLYRVLGFEKDRALSTDAVTVFTYDLSNGSIEAPDWIRMERLERPA
jgi:FkbH-like protein